MKPIVLLLKSHVDQYAKKDGTVVQAHDDKRQLHSVPHPSGKHKPGDHVFFPHPSKPGKNALGKYRGQRGDGSKSVVEHEGKEIDLDHDQVKPARGVPKSADPWDHVRASPEFKAAMHGRE